MSIATPLGVNEGDGWVRLGRRPGLVMRAYSFMRIQRGFAGQWRVWDAIQIAIGRHPYAETSHKTLRAAKQHAMRIVAGDKE